MDNSHNYESVWSDPEFGFFTPLPHCVVSNGDDPETFTPATVNVRWKNKATGAVTESTAFTVLGVPDANRLKLNLTPLGAFGIILAIDSACEACPEVEDPEVEDTPAGAPVLVD